MLNSKTIALRAMEILGERGHKTELSHQAQAVIEAICEAENDDQLLVSEAITRRINAVKETPSGRMKKPTLEEVQAHGVTVGLLNGECEKFFDFYESKGWKVGGQPMKLWTAAMANWKRNVERPAVNGSVETVKNQTALVRVEDRIKYLRGQFPLVIEKHKTEWNELKTERTRLMGLLGFKA